MVTIKTFKELALSFPETEELPHFEKPSFRINKKIFATLSEKDKKVCVKLSIHDQSVFCAFEKTTIYPVNNKWGTQGWTYIELNKIKKAMLIDVLTVSFCTAAPKRIADTFLENKTIINFD